MKRTMKILNLLLITALSVVLFFSILKMNDIENSVEIISKEMKTLSDGISVITEIQIRETKIIGDILKEIEKDNSFLENVEKIKLKKVVATMYHPVPEQTDDTPNITADGTMFDIETASDYRYIAVSRDLHSRYGGYLDFNDVVYVESNELSGLFVVKDLMNARFTNRIDFLSSPNEPPFKINSADLYVTNIKIVK